VKDRTVGGKLAAKCHQIQWYLVKDDKKRTIRIYFMTWLSEDAGENCSSRELVV
jgi:hypothetical protein